MEAQSSQPCDVPTSSLFNQCHNCKQDSLSKSPKLLKCLHNYCTECLAGMKIESSGSYVCIVCQQETAAKEVTDNKFLAELRARSEACGQSTSDHICQGCEEHVTSTSYCTECSDWLCDDCVFAHRRVKVTKDHVIQPKANVQTELHQKDKIEFCPVHPCETLKFFCPSCDALTCRDCQLHEHQKHDFKSVLQASNEHKNWLLQMSDKLSQQVTSLEQAQEFITSKIEEINQKEKTETEKIQKFAIIFITEINRRGRDMVQDLKELCHNRRSDLQLKQINLARVVDRYKHTIQFTDEIIKSASNSSLLQTRSVVAKQIISLRQAMLSMPNPNYKFDVAFGFNPHLLRDIIPKLGQLTYNGKVYAGDHAKRRLQEARPQQAPAGAVPLNVSTTGLPRPPLPAGPAPGSSGIISSSTSLSSPQRPGGTEPTEATNRSPGRGSEPSRTPETNPTPDTSNQTNDPPPVPEVRVKKEKIDTSYDQTEISSHSTTSTTTTTTATSTSTPTVTTTSTRTASTDSLANLVAESPTVERFGTVLSIPELGLEAESRTVYIPASAPLPTQLTPKRTESQDDPNEDWCAVCHNGGDLLCCEYCPKVFHTKCHVPEVTYEPDGAWKCGLCVDENELLIDTEPSRHVMVNGERKRKAAVGLLPREVKTCERILLELFCHPNSVPFHEPVPKTTPGYYQIVKHPMDLQTVASKLQPKHFNHYNTVQEFIDDVSVIFANCKLYNSVGSEVREWGVIVETYFMETLQRLCPFIKFELPRTPEVSVGEPATKRLCTETGDS